MASVVPESGVALPKKYRVTAKQMRGTLVMPYAEGPRLSLLGQGVRLAMPG